MLSESEVYRRWESPASNFHRKRANLLADALLCEPFATRDVAPEGIPDVSDPAAVSNAVFEAPSCVNCHQAMDPLASHLWGFKVQVKRTTVAKGYEANCRDYNLEDESEVNTYVPGQYCYPLEHYTVSDESLWVEAGTRPPGYYGLPSHDLVDLGQNIAADPRFALCTARTFYGYLTQQDKRDVPLALVSDLTEVFVDSGFDAKALARAIVLSESFRAVRTGSDEETGAAGVQVIRPEQFARTIEDLTGFRWIVLADLDSCSMPTLTAGGTNCWGAVDLAVSDQFGFRGMSGGMNSYYSTAPTHTVTPPKETVMARYAAEAAGYVVTADFGESDASARQLLTLVEPWDSDEALVREQIVALYLRILGQFVTSDDESVDATYALFETRLEVDGNGVEAWKLTLTALLLHPRMMFY